MHASMCNAVDSGRDSGPPFFDIRVCHPNADLYKELSPKQIYKLHEDEKKRKYASRIIEVENGTFTPLEFTTTGGCLRSVSGTIPGLPSSSLQRSRRTTLQQSHDQNDQIEGVLRHPADCPCLFEGNKVTEKKDKCTGE